MLIPRIVSAAISGAIIMCLGSLASAQNANDVCNAKLDAEDFVGNYTVQIGSAVLTDGATIVPLNANDAFAATFFEIDGQLTMESSGTTIAFALADENEPDWVFDPQADLNISSSEFEQTVGCAIANLPRLIGTGTSKSQEGTDIVFVYRLIAWSRTAEDGVTNMLGSLKWSGGGLEMSRVVMLARN